MKPHITAIFSGLILVAVGMFSFFANESRPLTALIGPIVGLFFIFSAPAIKKENKLVAHIVVGLTFLFAIVTGYMAYSSTNMEPGEIRERRIQVFSAMAITCTGAFAYYINGFISRKKEELENN